jgi:4-diphosphocytidyl-2-C-methyl-D-erythritol kinase
LTIHRRPAGHGVTISVGPESVILNDAERSEGSPPSDRAAFADVPTDHRNLCWQAAQALSERAGAPLSAHIAIAKQIPPRAGLGGGSSDAAGALVGLNELFGLGLDRESLAEVAAAVGSDVPFFLTGGAALIQGRGERVTPLECGGSRAVPACALALPDLPFIATAEAYARLNAPPFSPPAGGLAPETERMVAALESNDLDRIAAALHNDFERVIFAEFAPIARLRDDLLAAGCRGALLAGSGAAVFGLAESRPQAEAIAARCRPPGGWSAAAGGSVIQSMGSALVIQSAAQRREESRSR